MFLIEVFEVVAAAAAATVNTLAAIFFQPLRFNYRNS